ncbi:MAG: riboflavin synthase [Acidobacteria bacterium]|nr:MAG: riboflavin synthase [Acidobacteriota bacterium]
MFTGIIEATGALVSRQDVEDGAVLRIAWSPAEGPLSTGESVAVSGVCLTVIRSTVDWFEAECSPHTLRMTTLGQLPLGSLLNLERSLPAGGRMGGHFVQGHVDGVGKVLARRPEGDSLIVAFSRPESVSEFLVPRGSVSVNGVSLTISDLQPERFEVALIPHTLAVTNLDGLAGGSPVNLEADILGKYVRHFLQTGSAGPWREGI